MKTGNTFSEYCMTSEHQYLRISTVLLGFKLMQDNILGNNRSDNRVID